MRPAWEPKLWDWTNNTGPFTTEHDGQPACFSVRQIADRYFQLNDSFRFHSVQFDEPIDVTPEQLGDTDLASIPLVLTWFVSRYGRHTAAALAHDELITPTSAQQAVLDVPRAAADLLLLEGMERSGVGPLRAHVIYSGVTLATRLHAGLAAMLAMILWLVVGIGVGPALLTYAAIDGNWPLIIVAIALPIPASLLWGSYWRAGILGGYALWFFVGPTVLCSGSYWVVYYPAERVWSFLRKRRHPEWERARPVRFRDL